MKRTLITASVFTLSIGSATLAAAAPPGTPSLTIDPPLVTCAENEVVVTASVVSEADLSQFLFAVERWETINTSYWPNQHGNVEVWAATFFDQGRKATPVPKEHTLDTLNETTWSWHRWADASKYQDNSAVFIVYVDATAQSSGRSGSVSARTQWLVDCDVGTAVVAYDPWDLGWQEVAGTL